MSMIEDKLPSLFIREPNDLIRKAIDDICIPTGYINIVQGLPTDIKRCDAIILPTTIRGFLDFGLALKASVRFGWDLMIRLESIAIGSEGYTLRPWSAHLVHTMDQSIPFAFCVPLGASNEPVRAGVAAAMRAIHLHNTFSERKIQSIAMMPSCFASENMSPTEIAQQTVKAIIQYLHFARVDPVYRGPIQYDT